MARTKDQFAGLAISEIPPDALLSQNKIAAALHINPKTAKKILAREDFPPSIVIDGGFPQWRASSVAKFLDRVTGPGQ